jgi:ABC-type transport system involved in multi-copper enzyme maturation permease subunit
MKRVGVVALNTFREAVRDRVLYNLVFFGLVMIAASILVGQISIGIEQMVLVSLGLSAISVIGLLIAVFIGVGLVSKEMDKRTLYALLAKPVRRWEFLLGKFCGLVVTLTVNTIAMAIGLFLALSVIGHNGQHLQGSVLVAVYFILLKLALVVALALLFSCYTTPLIAILCTVALYVAGLFIKEMRTFQSDTLSPALQHALRGLSYLLPNFENFDVMAAAAHGRAIPAALIAQNTAYAALYCAVVLAGATAIFARRNLK